MKNIRRVNDLTGKRFGRLEVIGMDDKDTRKTYWVCKCDCGNIKSIRSDALIEGKTISCGCRKKEQDRINLEANHKHKQSGTRLYNIWLGMKGRCYNPNNARYMSWGGRGIEVCEEWKNSFENFYEWALANGYDDNLSIDRIDNDGNYEPSNCRWATIAEQCNNRRSNINVRIGNTTKSLKEWCDIFQLEYGVVNARYDRGIESLEELFKA